MNDTAQITESTPPGRVTVPMAGAVLGIACGQAMLAASLWWLLPLICGVLLVVVLRWTPTVVSSAIFVGTATAGAAMVAGIGDPDFRGGGVGYTLLISGMISGTVLAAVSVRATRRLQRRELHHAKELARSLAAERDAHIAAALVQERADLAGQIHDQLGHRLTLSTVRLGRFGLDDDLTDDQRRTITAVRDETANITAELGSLVQMLDRGARNRAPDRTPSEIVSAGRAAGLDIDADLSALDGAQPASVAAMAEVLEETVANAARHAPAAPVTIDSGRIGKGVGITISNPCARAETGRLGAGTGLARVGDRVRADGGRFEACVTDGRFIVSASLP